MGKRARTLSAAKTLSVFGLPGLAVPITAATPPKVGEPQPNPRWIHITNQGSYEGYPSGPVDITRQTLEQIVKNFKSDPRFKLGGNGLGEGKVVPFDIAHVSEMDPRIGDPAVNEKAYAWVMDVQIRDGENGKAQLWGWTYLGDEAKAMIEKGELTYTSIAYNPHAVHPVHGTEIGALMTSVAFTNKPFVRDLTPLAASDFASYLHANPEFASLIVKALKERTEETPPMLDVKKLCKVFGLNHAAEGVEDELVALAGEHVTMKRGLAEVLKATGFTDLAELIKNIPELLKAKTELAGLSTQLADALKQLGGFETQVAEAEVSAAMSVHKLPEVSRVAMSVFLKNDPKGFREKYPIPDEQRSHLLTTLAAGKGGAQYQTKLLDGDKAAGGNSTGGTGGGEKIDLRAFTGRNVTEKIIAYLTSKDAGFAKLPHQQQCSRAYTFRQQQAPNLVLA